MNMPVKTRTDIEIADLSETAVCERIEAFVREQRGSLFHRPQWLRAVEAGTGQKASGLIASQMGVVTGWLPLTQVRSILFPPALVSSGFGIGGGICAQNEAAIDAIANAAERFAVRHSFPSIELRGGTPPSHWEIQDEKHCGFERSLAADDEAELLAIPRKARAEVRKGLNSDLVVQVGRDAQHLDWHYEVYSHSVRNLGTPVFPRQLFTAMLDAFRESSDILTVLRDGKPLASVLTFYHEGTAMPYWGGGTHAARAARANELMYYKLMRHARERGMTRFDFGRSKTDSGPYRFKKHWGFEPQPIVYAHWTAPGAEARDIDPTSEAYSRKIELWKKLPLPVANAIGPVIARGLA